MKIELEEVLKIGEPPWYRIMVNGDFVIGSIDREKMEKKYEEIKDNPKMVKEVKKVLLSTII